MSARPWKLAVSAVCTSLCVSPAVAVEAPPALETLVVTASRDHQPWLTTPGTVTKIGVSSQLPGLRIDSAEVLRGLPGLQVDSRSNFAQDTRLVLRGFGARSAFGVRGMDIRLDNIPLAMPDGQAQLGSVLLDEVSSVEVLRGPLATLYGNGAGGVIRLETEAPEANQLKAGISAGENNSQRQNVSGSWRSGSWGARAQGSHLQSDGFRDHSEVERYQAGAQLYYRGEDGLDVTLRLDGSRDPETLDPSGLTPEQWREDPEQVNPRMIAFNTRKKLKHRQASLNIEKTLPDGAWQVALWHGRRNVDQWLGFEGREIDASGAVIDLQRDFSGLQASYRHDTSLASTPLSVTLGASLERMEDLRRGYVNEFGLNGELRRDEDGKVDSDDVFTLLEWLPTQALTVLGGVRYSRSEFSVDDRFIVPSSQEYNGNPDDSGSLDFSETSTALGVSYKLAPQWAIFGSVGRGFETPTLTEMAYRNEGTGLNTQLTPSTNTQLEAGLRYSAPATLHWALTTFSVESEDELVVDQSIGGRTTYSNAAGTQRHGLEFEGEWLLSSVLSARGSATWLTAEYSEGPWDGNRLPGVAEHQAYAQLSWQPWQSAAINFSSRYRSEVAAGDDNLIEAPSYVTFDLGLSGEHQWGNYSADTWLRLENITDKTYVGSVIVNQDSKRSFEPAQGRTVAVGIEVEI